MLGIIPFAHSLLENSITDGDFAVDCTVGNGHDTQLLAKLVGYTGYVYGFDVQEEAITKTKRRLTSSDLNERVTLFHCSHEHIFDTIPKENHKKIKAAIFNLGYLPGGNKDIVTKPASTLTAIESLLSMLPKNGVIVLVIYHGHEEGKKEKEAILSYVKNVDQQKANVLKYGFINQINNPPFVIAIKKK